MTNEQLTDAPLASIVLAPRHSVVIQYTWVAICFLGLIDIVWMRHTGIVFAPKTLFIILIFSLLLFALSFIYRHVRPDNAIWLGAQVTNQLILGSCALATFSYLTLRLGYPLMDAQFTAWDQHVGFDWLAYINWAESHPWAAHIFTVSYMLEGPESIVLLLALCFLKEFAHFHRMALGFLLGGLITVLVAACWPGLSAYIYHNIDPAQYPHLQVAAATVYKNEFFAMRNHTMQTFPEAMQGIVAFPSFHCMLAVFAIFAAMAIPIRGLRAGVIMLNILILLSTPVDGGHYLVDSLSGIVIGVMIAVCAVRWIPKQNLTYQKS